MAAGIVQIGTVQTFARSILPVEVSGVIGTGGFMLDIGVNDGADTFTYLREMPHLKIYAFEPEPTAIEKFRLNNTYGQRCLLFETAVGATTERVAFRRSSIAGDVRAWNQSGSLCTPTGHLQKHPWCEFKHQILVDCVKLDAWAEQFLGSGHVPFIKADVQGAEHLLISGGRKTLKRTRYFYTEYDDAQLYDGQLTLAAIEKALPWFTPVGLFQNNVLLKNIAI